MAKLQIAYSGEYWYVKEGQRLLGFIAKAGSKYEAYTFDANISNITEKSLGTPGEQPPLSAATYISSVKTLAQAKQLIEENY